MEDYRKDVGRRIRELRLGQHLSQEDLAHKAGVTTKTVSRWENGRHSGYIGNVKSLAEALGVEPEEIVGRPPSPLGLDQPTTVVGPQEQLDRIEAELEASRAEQQNLAAQIAHQNANLEAQSQILARLEKLVGVLTGQDEAAGHPLRTVAQVAEILEAARHPAQTTPPAAKTRRTGGRAGSRAS